MSRNFGIALLALASAALAACNVVVSPTPVFSKDDVGQAPVLKPGVWAAVGCDADPDGCGVSYRLTGDTMEPVNTTEHGKPVAKAERGPYLLVAGNPPIIQMELPEEGSSSSWMFFAIRPIAFDAAGEVTEMDAWTVLCGPPGPTPPTLKDATPGGKAIGSQTEHPFPGLALGDQSCTPADKAAVRNAAAASEAIPHDPGRLHWIGE